MNCPKCGAEPYNGSSGQSWECGSYETYGKFIQFATCELQQEREAHNATRAENERLLEDKRRLDGLEAIPHQIEIVCKYSAPKSLGVPTLRSQIDYFLANAPSDRMAGGEEASK